MNKIPAFVSVAQVLRSHDKQIARFGGAPGVRDASLLESAVMQPQNVVFYDPTADIFDVAAAYAYHIAKNHPFFDGNKRAAFSAAVLFLRSNQVATPVADEDTTYEAMIALVEDRWDKKRFAQFLREHAVG